MHRIFFTLLGLGFTVFTSHGELHTAGYSAWWSTANASYFNGAFEDQAKYLDEICYFGEFQFDSSGTIVVAGQAIVSQNGTTWSWNTGSSRADSLQSVYNKVHSVSPTTKVTFTIGGWENSQNFDIFSDTNDPTGSKATYAANQVRAILDLSGGRLHGVDLDWEDGDGVSATMVGNESSYLNLTTAIRSVLQGSETLTAAIQANRYSSGLAIINQIDVLRPFTYDAPEFDSNHTSLAAAQGIIANWIAQGVPASKLAVGSGFYARPLVNPWSNTDTYTSLDHTSKAITGEWLSDATTSYLGWGFDGVDSIHSKSTWAQAQGLHTFFCWELGQDNQSTELDNNFKSHYLNLTRALTEASIDPNAALKIKLSSVSIPTNQVGLTWSSQMGESYRIEASNTMAPSSWSILVADLPATDGNQMSYLLTDPGIATPNNRFWRVVRKE